MFDVIIIFIQLFFFFTTVMLFYLGFAKGDAALRNVIEKKFQVEIRSGFKGHWKVVSPIAWYKRFAIELIQLGYILTLWAIWMLGLLATIMLINLLQKLAGV